MISVDAPYSMDNFWSLTVSHGMPTFKTEALHLVGNVQLVKGLLLRNEW